MMDEAVPALIKMQHRFSGFVDSVIKIDYAVDAYGRFDRREVQKVVLDFTE
jgi:hypothetical protein